MKTVYLNPKQFSKVKPTKTFPNPLIIEGLHKGKICRIEKTCNIEYYKPTNEQIQWHGLNKDSYILRSENGHFPTDIVMTVNNKGRFEDGLKIGAIVGRNLGSASLGIVNIQKAIELLTKNNFIVTEKII